MDRDRMALVEEQVDGLIDLVLSGVDADDLIDSVYEEINEGPGNGPYHIGSKVKINSSWSGQGVGGESVSVSRGDVVSVVQANLGEEGQDRMVMLADGKTRVIVPYAILGEGIEEQDDTKKGPKGHEVPPAKGKLGGMIQGKAQGDSLTPEKKAMKPPKGSSSPSSIPSTFQGKGKPKDAPTAQVKGMMAPTTISGKTVEQITDSVLSTLEELSENHPEADKLHTMLLDEDDEIMLAIMHEGLFSDEEYTLSDLQEIADMMKDKKKKNKKCKSGNGDDDEDEGYTEEDIKEIFQVMKKVADKKKKK